MFISKPKRSEAEAALEAFALAMDETELVNAYGENWPRKILPDEHCLLFHEKGGRCVAWSLIRPDETEPFFHRLIGVWPRYQGQGRLQEIATHTMTIGFGLWPKTKGSMSMILDTNKRYLDYKLKLIASGKTKEKYAARVLYPAPGWWWFWTAKEDVVPDAEIMSQWEILLSSLGRML